MSQQMPSPDFYKFLPKHRHHRAIMTTELARTTDTTIDGLHKGHLMDFNLDTAWNSNWLIANLRSDIRPLVDNLVGKTTIPFDPQDLEHQALFELTTLNPGFITPDTIEAAVDGQLAMILERMRAATASADLEYLFRGLTGRYVDLNCAARLKLTNRNGFLIAIGSSYSREVEFRLVEDQKQIELFTSALHYIHQKRSSGKTFGLYFKGDVWPWAIETTELASLARPYKRHALTAHGINPDRAVELTRLYTLPGCPLNAISILDSLVARHFRNDGLEAMFTRTMPAYSKSKSTTVAGGMNKILCLKELRHYFIPRELGGQRVWSAVSRRYLENNPEHTYRETNPGFGLMPAVDVFLKLNRASGPTNPALSDGRSALYFHEPPLAGPTCQPQLVPGSHNNKKYCYLNSPRATTATAS